MNLIEREQAFSDKIDCRFPYSDPSASAALVAEANLISPNAAFCVFCEIVCPPPSARLSRQIQHDLLTTWLNASAYQLAAPLADMARHVIDGGKVTTGRAMEIMREVGATEGLYAALSALSYIAYRGSDCERLDEMDALDLEIRARWDACRHP